jgi:hypothetical protein
MSLSFLLLILCGVCTAHPEEHVSDDMLVEAYSSVFSVRGGATLSGVSSPVSYAVDRLRALVDMGHGEHLDLSKLRTLDQPALLALAFKAVAGEYVTGPANFNAACHFTADPVTGTLELYHNTAESATVLAVVSTVLLAVLVTIVAQAGTPAATPEQPVAPP